MTDQAIVLAGGLGTRLRSVVNDIPKPMARVNDVPFLSYILNYLSRQKIKKVILSVGYKANVIKNYYENSYKGLFLQYSMEEQPLGTGGAILHSIKLADNEHVFVMNGDTLFRANLRKISALHKQKKADITIALRQMHECRRYGMVKIDAENRITGFIEKEQQDEGYINGGIYIINKKWFEALSTPEIFSLENDILTKKCGQSNFYGLGFNEYFIDIGVPKDYQKALDDLKDFSS